MVFAVNCGQDGSPNSFTNFKNSALQIGASLSSSAAAASTAAPSGTATAAYGGYTIPPAVRQIYSNQSMYSMYPDYSPLLRRSPKLSQSPRLPGPPSTRRTLAVLHPHQLLSMAMSSRLLLVDLASCSSILPASLLAHATQSCLSSSRRTTVSFSLRLPTPAAN